jgi:Protein of unknown function (DUF1091)
MFITNLTVKTNPGISDVTIELKNVPNDQIVKINMTFFKRIDLQIMVNFRLSKIEGKTIKRILQAPKLNYCDFRRHGRSVPILSDLINVVASYGNLIFDCPAQPGTYSIEHFSVSKIPMLPIISAGNYLIISGLVDENVKTKPELIMQFKIYTTRK